MADAPGSETGSATHIYRRCTQQLLTFSASVAADGPSRARAELMSRSKSLSAAGTATAAAATAIELCRASRRWAIESAMLRVGAMRVTDDAALVERPGGKGEGAGLAGVDGVAVLRRCRVSEEGTQAAFRGLRGAPLPSFCKAASTCGWCGLTWRWWAGAGRSGPVPAPGRREPGGRGCRAPTSVKRCVPL